VVIKMKSRLPILITLLLTLVIFTFGKNITSIAAEEEEILILIETAQTPDDHMKIAEYYENQAMKMEGKSKRHESMGYSYKNRSKPWPSMVRNCEKLSTKYSDAAKEYKAMAEEHKKMAKEMQDQ